jgi:hypothetical protein
VGIVGGSFVISFLGAETGIAAICTRLAGVAETRELVVKESVWIGHRKWGADQCYQVELRGYSDMTAHPDRLCYAKPVESGTTIRITGWHSMLGSWYVDIDPAPDGPPPPRP